MLGPALTVQFYSYYLAITAKEEESWNQATSAGFATRSAQVDSQASWASLKATGKTAGAQPLL